jgi:hypothetical protein
MISPRHRATSAANAPWPSVQPVPRELGGAVAQERARPRDAVGEVLEADRHLDETLERLSARAVGARQKGSSTSCVSK